MRAGMNIKDRRAFGWPCHILHVVWGLETCFIHDRLRVVQLGATVLVMRQRYDLVRDPHSLLLGPEVGREERF
jgi:hypothetical protein